MVKCYTIAPLRAEHRHTIVERLRQYYENRIFTDILFSIYLVPEGNPPVDKAEACSKTFRQFQQDLKGIPVGILVNSLFGHGADRLCASNAFQKQIGIDLQADGRLKERIDVCCPLDRAFQEYAAAQFRQLAALNPHILMIDDDFRLLLPLHGCLCPLHVQAFNTQYHTSMTAEELAQHLIGTKARDIEIARQFDAINAESLHHMMRLLRETVDSVNPKIHGIICCGPNDLSYLEQNARIFAGREQLPEVRIGNARYLQPGNRNFPKAMHMTMLQKGLLSPDVITLSEADTFPHTRYSMGARELHATCTGHLLEGCAGFKQWIMRMVENETASEKAYAAILAKYTGFYEALATLIPGVRFSGPANLYPGKMPFPWNPPRSLREISSWSTILTGRMGLPVHFRRCGDSPGMLTASEIPFYSDQELRRQLERGVILDGGAACALSQRGFASLLGVTAAPFPTGHRVMEEQLSEHPLNGDHAEALMSPPARQVQLTPLTAKTEILSWFVQADYMRSPEKKRRFPGATLFRNGAGGCVAVFASSPDGLRGMAYFNQSRKEVLTAVMNTLEPMAAFYPGDAEIYLKSGWIDSRTIFISLLNLGCDPLEEVELELAGTATEVEFLQSAGTFAPVSFLQRNRRCQVHTPLETMLPLILKVTMQ